MYEEMWYSFPTERRSETQGRGHRRRESLLQQPNGANSQGDTVETLDALFEEEADEQEDEIFLQARADGLLRRVQSYPDVKTANTRPKWAAVAAEAAASSTAAAAATRGLSRKNSSRGKPPSSIRRRTQRRKKDVSLEALSIADSLLGVDDGLEWKKLQEIPVLLDTHDAELLEASQQEFLTYRDQLDMTERHLGQLVDDTNGALRLLSSLADSFRSVEEQTTSFQSQCDDLVSEQRRLKTLADEVGTDLHYYGYLDNATRRLNSPGAGRLADVEELSEIITSLDSCIHFMAHHKEYRDAESYLARYQALLTKSLHLLEVGFTARLEKVSTELSKQIAATKSDAAQHALAYGRFEELLVDSSYALIPNVQQVISSAYTQLGAARTDHQSYSIYSNTANNIFRTYLQWRDQALRPLVQKELDTFHADTKDAKSAAGSAAVETASRGFIKQSFERSYHEVMLFAKVFAIDPQYSSNANSVFATLRAYRSNLVNAVNVVPLATLLQTALTAVNDLPTVCNVLGWVTHEYLLLDYDDDDNDSSNDGNNDGNDTSYLASHSRQMAARLLAEHLWVFADALFEAEVAKTITKVPVAPEALKIAPVANGQAASNAYPPVRRAIELLIMFDQAMPKERCQRNSPVVFKIVRETILALQRAEARIKSARISTDPDLFMIKNLLILKNELLSLEIGDIRNDGSGAGGMQHFGQIWDALSLATNLVGYFSTFIPGTSLWSRATGAVGGGGGLAVGGSATLAKPAGNGYTSVASRAASVVGSIAGSTRDGMLNMLPNGPVAPSASDQDVSEQLDEALRRSINAFTQRWGKLIFDGTSRKLGGKNVAKIERELDELLQTAFSNQPEVMLKLKEAIQNVAQAATEQQSGNKISRV